MYHFFAPGEDVLSGRVTLTGGDVNHIRNVLRLKAGDTVIISDGSDRDAYCRITEITAESIVTEVLPEAVEETELPVHFHLFQGLPKADKMEYILQKAVELGAASVTPVEMKRCVMKLDEKKKTSRCEKWQKQAESAAKQSGRRRIPGIKPVLSFRESLKAAAALDKVLVPYECAEDMNYTREILAGLQPGEEVGIFIGPEGGFDPAEIEALQSLGAKILTLGHRILRTETAGPAMLAMCVLAVEDRT